MAPGLGARLRHLAKQFNGESEPIVGQYEGIRDAAVALEASVAEAFPEDARRRVWRGTSSLTEPLQRARRKNQYLRVLLKEARHQVKELIVGRQRARSNRMTPEFLQRVCHRGVILSHLTVGRIVVLEIGSGLREIVSVLVERLDRHRDVHNIR